MRKTSIQLGILMIGLLFSALTVKSQNSSSTESAKTTDGTKSDMKTYVIERNIPGAGEFSAEKLKAISQTSCTVLKEMGPDIQWLHSYVTDNKIFCVYKAKNIELLKEHAQRGGFPINAVYEVETVISPETAK